MRMRVIAHEMFSVFFSLLFFCLASFLCYFVSFCPVYFISCLSFVWEADGSNLASVGGEIFRRLFSFFVVIFFQVAFLFIWQNKR